MKIVKNDLFDYNLYIYQFSNGFKFSLDSILLAEFTKITKRDKNILDLCSGNASVPLILSTKTNVEIKAFEIQKEIYELAVKSIKENKLEHQIKIINDNILNIENVFPGKYFDIITCNPPYFPIKNDAILNKNDYLTIARHELCIKLDEIFKIVKNHLSENGNFYLVHRPNRLDEIIILARNNGMNVKEVQLIVTKNNIPSIVLVKCQKNSRPGIKFKKIIDVSNLSTYQQIFKEE